MRAILLPAVPTGQVSQYLSRNADTREARRSLAARVFAWGIRLCSGRGSIWHMGRWRIGSPTTHPSVIRKSGLGGG